MLNLTTLFIPRPALEALKLITKSFTNRAFSLQLDTGSSDIWFPNSSANVCLQNRGQYCPFGTYDQSASTSYADPKLPQFDIQYVDNTQISGQYISDVLTVGGSKLTNMTMAVANELNAAGIGIMGVGFRADESSAQTQGFTYPNVVEVMQSEGLIKSKTYSLWLDDLNSNTGSILFGGVDSDKYTGSLIALPIQLDSQSNSITSFTVAWTGLTVSGSGNNGDFSPSSPQPAILDSGTTDTLLPDSIAEQIFNGVGVTTSKEYGNLAPCELANDNITFAFTFGGSGGPTINVPLSEFVVPLLTSDGRTPKFRDGKDACQFAIEAAGSNPILFGDSFLRSAYVVYDLDNQQVAIAQTNFVSHGDLPIVAGLQLMVRRMPKEVMETSRPSSQVRAVSPASVQRRLLPLWLKQSLAYHANLRQQLRLATSTQIKALAPPHSNFLRQAQADQALHRAVQPTAMCR